MQTRRIYQAALIFLIAAFSAGCGGSRPVKYYVIDIGQPPVNSAAPQIPVRLLVSRVTASSLYREDRLVYGTGSVQLGTYEYDRWATIPTDMLQDMVVSALRSTGSYRSVSPIASNLRGDFIVRGHLYALDEVDKPVLSARFSFQLELFDPKAGTTIWSGTYTHDEPVTVKKAKVSDVVEALNTQVRTGLTQLTSDMGQYLASHPPQAADGQ